MSLFQTVKDNVTTLQAAGHYGLKVSHNGMCKCPFHADKNPSMKVDKRFHCFGCQADGDVISFTSRLFNVSLKDAAIKLADDFGIQYDPLKATQPTRKHIQLREEEVQLSEPYLRSPSFLFTANPIGSSAFLIPIVTAIGEMPR